MCRNADFVELKVDYAAGKFNSLVLRHTFLR